MGAFTAGGIIAVKAFGWVCAVFGICQGHNHNGDENDNAWKNIDAMFNHYR
jgi:hypothetical protein